MTDATIPESHRDLLDSPVATLATIGRDGRPQVSAVWFLAEGDTVVLSLKQALHKTRNLERNGACSLFILDLANPYRYLELRGDAEIVPDPTTRWRTGWAKYGVDLRTLDQPGETRIAVTVRPIRARAR